MDTENLMLPEGLDVEVLRRVWKRVSPEPAAPEPETAPEARAAALLEGFIRRAAGAGGMYALLALKTRGTPAERVLRELASAERTTERRLQTEYFLLTGDTLARKPAHPSAPYLMRALREAHAGELDNAARYEHALPDLPDGRLRALFLELATVERRHAGTLRGLIGKLIQ